MKVRLYNEFGAGVSDHSNNLYSIMSKAMDEVLTYCREHNIDLRDAQLSCMTDVNIEFCGEILRDVGRLRRLKEKENETN